MERHPEEQFVNSLIGFGSSFRGDIEIQGFVRIDGDFSGTIQTENKVLIGGTGRADCTISARLVVIGGIFRGTVYAQDKILILPSAIVLGNFYTPRLVVDIGGILSGNFFVSGKPEKQSDSLEEHNPKIPTFRAKSLFRSRRKLVSSENSTV